MLEKLSSYTGIYLSGISLAIFTPKSRRIIIERLTQLAAAGVRIYFDCNYRPHLWESPEQAASVYSELYRISDILFLTTEEAEVLLNGAQGLAVGTTLRSLGAKEIVVKDGERPCTIFFEDQVVTEEAQVVAQVVDTTAAGDSFSGIYLVARHHGCSPGEAARMAHATAAYVVCHKGAIVPLDGMPVTGQDIVACGRNRK